LIAYFSNIENVFLIEKLKEKGLQFEVPIEETLGKTEKLAGKTFVISGVFTKFSRDEIKDLIEKNGGKNVGSVSSKTNFLVAGDNMGPAKLEKATQLGVQIISEDEFIKMIGVME
ncbi:MAG: NAD-dependent DNA ligase LigA, partial [Bacteroidetes bacterium]|nr:NAD-dependent DNA ligase LigA [Bacteroidota bacterium]